MKKLIPMVAFVIYINSKEHSLRALTQIRDYANFLSQILELWMFVPCDKEGNVLKEPEKITYTVVSRFGDIFDYRLFEKDNKEYQEAKERCLFKGIEYVEAKKEGHYSFLRITQLSPINYPQFWKGLTIEDLIKYNLELTETAQKQIGYE